MRRTSIAAVLMLLVLGSIARASDPIGVYALVDRVVMEPSEGMPERVQIHGVFTMADQQSRSYTEPVRGYLYYSLPASEQEAARTEWSGLTSLAGTGQVVGFGNRYKAYGRIRTDAGPDGTGDEAHPGEVELLLAKLNDADQSVRDRATEELGAMGRQVEPALRRALGEKPSAEVRARLERLSGQFTPDEYPVGWGMQKFRQNTEWPPVKRLRLTPAIVQPAQGIYVQGGRVTLVAQNVTAADAAVKYVFEIEDVRGERQTSEPIAPGLKQTEWTPTMQITPGAKYTWRVYATLPADLRKTMGEAGKVPWPVDRGPAVSATFRGK
jgi:hypothetical protein